MGITLIQMVDLNPEEETKAGGSRKDPLSETLAVPPKTVAEICEVLACCVLDAANHRIDFFNFLCDAALNLDADKLETEKPAVELFLSEEFVELGNLVNSWLEIQKTNRQSLADFMLVYRTDVREKAF